MPIPHPLNRAPEHNTHCRTQAVERRQKTDSLDPSKSSFLSILRIIRVKPLKNKKILFFFQLRKIPLKVPEIRSFSGTSTRRQMTIDDFWKSRPVSYYRSCDL